MTDTHCSECGQSTGALYADGPASTGATPVGPAGTIGGLDILTWHVEYIAGLVEGVAKPGSSARPPLVRARELDRCTGYFTANVLPKARKRVPFVGHGGKNTFRCNVKLGTPEPDVHGWRVPFACIGTPKVECT